MKPDSSVLAPKGVTGSQQQEASLALLSRVTPELYRVAYDEGMNLTTFFERLDPTPDGVRLDAFERLLRASRIILRSVPEHGLQASPWEALHTTPALRALVPELASRVWRAVLDSPAPHRRGVIVSSDDTLYGSVERAWMTRPGWEWDVAIAPPVPLDLIVAQSTGIRDASYRAAYLVSDATQTRFVRVGETAEIPRATIVSGEKTVTMLKFGRGIEASYEAMRRMPVDKVLLFVQRLAAQAAVDEVAWALHILVNGDGNPNTEAQVSNLTTLDPDATAGTLTLKAWLAFLMEFQSPYMLTVALGQNASILDLMLLPLGQNVPFLTGAQVTGTDTNTRSLNMPLLGQLTVGWTADAPASTIVGVDGRMALERIYEIGADLAEVEAYASRQTTALFLTEVMGFAVLDTEAARVLNLAA